MIRYKWHQRPAQVKPNLETCPRSPPPVNPITLPSLPVYSTSPAPSTPTGPDLRAQVGYVPLQITWRILASLASLSMVNMVARVMPMYGMNSNTVGHGQRSRGVRAGESAERTAPPAAPPAPAQSQAAALCGLGHRGEWDAGEVRRDGSQ